MIVSLRAMRRTLQGKLKFSKSEKTKHEWYELLDANGDIIVSTALSRGAAGRDISNNLFSIIAREVGLESSQLADAVRCPLKRRDYYRILREKGLATTALS